MITMAVKRKLLRIKWYNDVNKLNLFVYCNYLLFSIKSGLTLKKFAIEVLAPLKF